ncbi:hypothetical protein [Methylobacterium oryzisoli]|uniref:hypothetical protein n=1 Tax=Methylobacterium oryzisoli TaxID=3385502 RepID=UPI0038919D74
MPNRGYALRRGRQGWDVYAEHTGKPVQLNGRAQIGLSRALAVQLAASLSMLAPTGSAATELPATERGTIH